MKRVLIIGAGKVGSLMAGLLADSQHYDVFVADIDDPADRLKLPVSNIHTLTLDVRDQAQLSQAYENIKPEAVISCLPYYVNLDVAKFAKKYSLHYFDTTEDISVSEKVAELAEGEACAYVSRCGLAPGFINIVASSLMKKFDELDVVKMRVGCLPVATDNALKYSLTWSTDGLINEYGNMAYGIENGEKIPLQPLEGLETVEVDGIIYEAFTTSGGVGSLVDSYVGKVNTLNYKTLRYPGHCEKMRLLMKDLKLNSDRDTLKRILENALPQIAQDVALIYVSVKGIRDGDLFEEHYVNKIYSNSLWGREWSAIQLTTASGVCAVLDIVLNDPQNYHGLIHQEDFALNDILANHFGRVFADSC